ncbi:hypothetical protein DIJ64_13835 [Mycobacterium leprae]|uniref:Uncharacterized protein n=1 Tax=Mycobacterium leprae TaxID=1769 RepID=A0AAD0KTN9_MYCLR|nr:hypothetical protein DIJ64_13835 [Mycobacterium leprae]OAR20483.1 hypothetical protein A8144_02355 [Mycobacterium leprae 3125609]OAX72056.1 hypothetical protein A3216_02435 [Mycobacterium leprae 7935681]
MLSSEILTAAAFVILLVIALETKDRASEEISSIHEHHHHMDLPRTSESRMQPNPRTQPDTVQQR